ncbi:MAG TPA: MTAP family purine nucleoside phosphorylase, partial [bacterium]|nr:MTAP family purine nucleoside phosphorylase [bacterium]
MVKVGLIGGSGLEDPKIFQEEKELIVNTPYGQPSLPLIAGKIEQVPVVILPRHGKDHTLPPTQVNYRANIWALKEQGCTHLLATTACGSLREEIHRGDLVILDQFIDFTRHRPITFFERFEPGQLKHTPMADPFSEELRQLLIRNARRLNLPLHEKGTVVTIEG